MRVLAKQTREVRGETIFTIELSYAEIGFLLRALRRKTEGEEDISDRAGRNALAECFDNALYEEECR